MGPSESGPAKKEKYHNRYEHSSGDSYSYQGRFENYYGGRGGGGQFGYRSGGHHEHQNEGGYGSGNYHQQREDRYYQPRGEPRGRRFQGRRPYGDRGR